MKLSFEMEAESPQNGQPQIVEHALETEVINHESVCAQKQHNCCLKEDNCPQNEDNCLPKEDNCPQNENNCLQKEDNCPQNDDNCPQKQNNCPQNKDNCLQKQDNCLQNEDNCLQKRDNCPQKQDDCLEKDDNCARRIEEETEVIVPEKQRLDTEVEAFELVPKPEVNIPEATLQTTTKRKSINDDDDPNSTIHAFNASNITVIEQSTKLNDSEGSNKQDGSDSGVEVCPNEGPLQRAPSSNSCGYASSYGLEDPAQSCDSSLISCCSTFEDTYDLITQKNSVLLEDLKLNQCDLTSENGSESSSVTESNSSRPSKRLNANGVKKKVALTEPVKPQRTSHLNTPIVSKNSRGNAQKTTPFRYPIERSKSKERNGIIGTPRPSTLKTINSPHSKTDQSKVKLVRSTSTSRASSKTPVVTPTDDGRWPSNRNTTMTRSFRGTNTTSDTSTIKTRINDSKSTNPECKSTLDKYATLPRRRRERSADNIRDLQASRDTSQNRTLTRKQTSRENTPARTLPPKAKKPTSKTKIYHETAAQTCVTIEDINKAFAGVGVVPQNPYDVETSDSWVQCDRRYEKVELVEAQLKNLIEKNRKLNLEAIENKAKLAELTQTLMVDKVEKKALKDELERNMQRVQTILGNKEDNILESDNDSLLVLESRFQKAGYVIIKQENEISELHSLCRSLKRDLEKSLGTQNFLLQQQKELESEAAELQEFMQAEKSTLSEALQEAELKLKASQQIIIKRDNELNRQQDECKHLVRISEQRRQENLALQARLTALESRSRDLLLHQGAASSGASAALNGLISRIDDVDQQLINSYNISDKDLEEVIFHNEAYSNSTSSAEGSPERSKGSPDDSKKGSTFVMAVISAIKNAAAQSPFAQSGKLNSEDRSDSTEMLDSETEPCLMMENVLEDVPIQDGYSHNMISSSHSLLKSGMIGRSESLHNLSQAILNRQLSEQACLDGGICESMHGLSC